jgi:hypothetical protein
MGKYMDLIEMSDREKKCSEDTYITMLSSENDDLVKL